MKAENVTCEACGGDGKRTIRTPENHGDRVALTFVRRSGDHIYVGMPTSPFAAVFRACDVRDDYGQLIGQVAELINTERAGAEKTWKERAEKAEAEVAKLQAMLDRSIDTSQEQIRVITQLQGQLKQHSQFSPSPDLVAAAREMAEKILDRLGLQYDSRTLHLYANDLATFARSQQRATDEATIKKAVEEERRIEREAAIETAKRFGAPLLAQVIGNGEHRK